MNLHNMLINMSYYTMLINILFHYVRIIIELDDGKILTGKPDQFDGKNPWVSGSNFPLNQSSDKLYPLFASSSGASRRSVEHR